MPSFDFECNRCHIVVEEFFMNFRSMKSPLCKKCDVPMTRLYTLAVVQKHKLATIFPVDGITLEHYPGGERHFDSYKELKKSAKKDGLEIQAIL